MKELIGYIIRALVDKPEDVSIHEVKGEHTTIFELKVNKQDIGKIVGKQGRIIKAIRILLQAVSVKVGQKIVLEIVE